MIRSWYLYAHDRTHEADNLLQEVLDSHGNDPAFLRYVAHFYWYDMRLPERALVFYEKARRLEPANSDIFNDMAYCYLETGDIASARRSALTCIRLRPDSPNPYDTMGDVMRKVDADSALQFYELAVAKKGDFAISIEKIGYIQIWRGELDAARATFNHLMELSKPRDPIP